MSKENPQVGDVFENSNEQFTIVSIEDGSEPLSKWVPGTSNHPVKEKWCCLLEEDGSHTWDILDHIKTFKSVTFVKNSLVSKNIKHVDRINLIEF